MEKLDSKEFLSKLHTISEKLSIGDFEFKDSLKCYSFNIYDEEETQLFECSYDPNDGSWTAVFHEDSYDFSAADLKSLLTKVYVYILEGATRCGCSVTKFENGKWKLFSEYMHDVLDF